MSTKNEADVFRILNPSRQRPELGSKLIEKFTHSQSDRAVTLCNDDSVVVNQITDALATELTCMLHYKRNHVNIRGQATLKIDEEFLVCANEEAAHGEKLVERILQLGGAELSVETPTATVIFAGFTSNLSVYSIAAALMRNLKGVNGVKSVAISSADRQLTAFVSNSPEAPLMIDKPFERHAAAGGDAALHETEYGKEIDNLLEK